MVAVEEGGVTGRSNIYFGQEVENKYKKKAASSAGRLRAW